jgi:hypothetical protein
MEPVVVALAGGLGNQLFQFAAGLAVSAATGREARLCLRAFDRPAARRLFVALRSAVRSVGADPDGRFRLQAMERGLELLAIQRAAPASGRDEDAARGLGRSSLKAARRGARDIPGTSPLRAADDVLAVAMGHATIDPEVVPLLLGDMQDDRIVTLALPQLRGALRLPTESARCRRWLGEIRARPTVGVHVRRGDYRKRAFRGVFPLLDAGWYGRAAELLRERHGPDLRFAVFTDEPAWVRRNLRLPGELLVVSGDGPPVATEDLSLLSACSHHVIANSTFSWWAARLATGAGDVVAPTRWLMSRDTDPNLLPAGWIRLENEVRRD